MASITSLSGSSSTSSIYSNANAITGLASGLDTEALIEQAVSAYETKIASLQQDQTMVEWQQEAYREIIAKVVAFSEKYTSYSSDTNLFSNAFFEDAVNAIASGTYANLVSVSGTTDSSISILGVKQLATNASYSVSSLLNSGTSASSAVALSDLTKKSNITGTMTLKSGAGDTVTLTFDASDIVTSEEELAKLIQSKLEENADFSAWASKVSYSENGGIDFGDLSISAATGDLENVLAKDDEDDFTGELVAGAELYESDATVAEAIDGQTLTFTYNGTAKSIKLSALDEEGNALSEEAFLADLNTKLEDAFGSGVTAGYDVDGKLTFSAADNESLSVSGTALTTLGFSDTNQASYVDTSDTLRDLLGDSLSAYKNEDGLYDFTINGVKIGSYTADTSLSTIMADINSNEEAGVKVSFSKLSNSFQFTATESGSAGKVEISGGVAKALFGSISETGQDAILTVEANGKEVTLTRSSNTVDLDGMEVTLKGVFGDYVADSNELVDKTAAKANAVTFESKVDATELTSTLKEMVNDYNEMVKLIKEAYKTNPLKNSSGKRYEPLTDDDKNDMSESAIKAYEEKAKTGILFGDSDLSSMYYQLTSAITNNVVALNKIGITTNYSDGLTTLSLDEDALEKALEKDPNSVAEAFVGTDGNSGFMGAVDSVLDTYAKTTGATKGILLQKAGSSLAPTTVNDNTLQDKINDYEELIEKWQDKLADKVDYYTRQFTLLEQLMAEMNSQSSTISGLMGY